MAELIRGRQLIKKILRDLHGVPPMPDVVQKVLALTQDPDATAGKLQEVIELDQSLTAGVLKLCNSAYYGLPREIASVTQAVTYLGFRTIRNLVLTSYLSDIYGGTVTIVGFDPGGLWKHAVATALSAQLICQKIRRPGEEEIAFTCGVLHDVGKTILAKHAKEAMVLIKKKMVEEGIPYIEAERAVLGFDHAVLGAKVADTWNFPPTLVQAAGLHHNPSQAKGDRFLVSLTHLANEVALRQGAGVGQVELAASPIEQEALDDLGLTEEDLDELAEELTEAYHRATAFLDMGEEEGEL